MFISLVVQATQNTDQYQKISAPVPHRKGVAGGTG